MAISENGISAGLQPDRVPGRFLSRAIQNLAAQVGALFRPVRESLPRRNDGIAKILLRSAAEIREQRAALSACREDAAVLAANELAADVKLVSLLDCEPVLLPLHRLRIA